MFVKELVKVIGKQGLILECIMVNGVIVCREYHPVLKKYIYYVGEKVEIKCEFVCAEQRAENPQKPYGSK